PLLGLRTVDDVFLDLGVWSGITKHRTALARLRDICGHLDLTAAGRTCAGWRAVKQAPAFSVTANFVGKRNYSTGEIKQACAEGVLSHNGWCITENDAVADLHDNILS